MGYPLYRWKDGQIERSLHYEFLLPFVASLLENVGYVNTVRREKHMNKDVFQRRNQPQHEKKKKKN
jgi:hypothetical protein